MSQNIYMEELCMCNLCLKAFNYTCAIYVTKHLPGRTVANTIKEPTLEKTTEHLCVRLVITVDPPEGWSDFIITRRTKAPCLSHLCLSMDHSLRTFIASATYITEMNKTAFHAVRRMSTREKVRNAQGHHMCNCGVSKRGAQWRRTTVQSIIN